MRNRRVLIGLVAALLSFPVIAQNAAKSTRKQAATENADTLSGIWSQNWILKLKPCDNGYRLDTVSVLYEKYFGVLDYLNDPATPERYIAYNPDYYRMFAGGYLILSVIIVIAASTIVTIQKRTVIFDS